MHVKSSGFLIVMADGNINDHDLVKHAARGCNINHVFTSVYNGMQLMDLLRHKGAYAGGSQRTPDLIIMDIKLELTDGFEALKQIKSNDHLKDIPVYVLTKQKNDADASRALALGAREYFEKPLNPAELNQIIKNICAVSFGKTH